MSILELRPPCKNLTTTMSPSFYSSNPGHYSSTLVVTIILSFHLTYQECNWFEIALLQFPNICLSTYVYMYVYNTPSIAPQNQLNSCILIFRNFLWNFNFTFLHSGGLQFILCEELLIVVAPVAIALFLFYSLFICDWLSCWYEFLRM